MSNRKARQNSILVILAKVLVCGLLLLPATISIVYADTFVSPATITIDGTFTDWGTTGSPASGAYLFQDASNYGEQDGYGFNWKAGDINYFWTAVSTQLGGTTPASSSNLLQYFHYRFDTNYNHTIKGQSYYVQLNLGAASPGYADHLLQIWVDNDANPKVKLVLYEYNTPYPQIRAFTSGSITGKVSNVASPYPGFSGVQDTSAGGAMGKYDGTRYGVEVRIPVSWYSSTYGGGVNADGSGTPMVIGAVFTGTGSLGAVGTVKDTINDFARNTLVSLTDTLTGDTQFATDDITKIVFTTISQTILVGTVSAVMIIQTQDDIGVPKNVCTNTNIALSSTSATGRFDTNPAGAFDGSVTSVTIANGTSSAIFYYRDTAPGTLTITATENPGQGWTDATQQETIIGLSPTVTTNNATSVEETSATLNGTLNDDGGESCQYRFQYGTTAGGPYPSSTAWSGNITAVQAFSAGVTSLNPGTRYYFQAMAKNSSGAGIGAEQSFLTKPEAPTGFNASSVSGTQINLNWTKGDGAQRTMVRRQTGGYPANRNDGSEAYFDTGISFADAGLSPDTTYYYRAWSEVTGSQQWSDNYAETSATAGGVPQEPVAVGGIIYPVDKLGVLAPWISSGLATLSVIGLAALRLKRK